MLNHSTHRPRRAGFTLVEMLISTAVIMMLMVIITGAFAKGLELFSRLRAQAKLQETIRQAGTTIKDDLSWNHFQKPIASGYGDDNAYVRGQDLTKADSGAWSPPPAGFFRIVNMNDPDGGGNPFLFDGTDRDGFPFTRAKTHALHFTVQRPATGPDQMFRALDIQRAVTPIQNPPLTFPYSFIDPTDYRENGTNAFVTRWAEVAYFLNGNGESANGVPLFNLYRAQKLLLPLPSVQGTTQYAGPFNNNGGTNSAQVTVGQNYSPVPAAPSQFNYNPEISRRYILSPPDPNAPDVRPINPFSQQYPPPGGANDFEAYNRANDVTQPRFRFGMLPAGNRNNPNPPASARSYHNLAGLFQIATNNAPANATYQGRYPTLADELPLANDLRRTNDLLLTNVISFEVKALWSFRSTSTTFDPTSPPPVGFPNNYGYPTTYTVPNGAGTMQIPNADYPFDYIPLSSTNQALAARGLRVFDTWSDTGGTPYSWVDPAAPPQSQGKQMWQRTDAVANSDATAARLPLRIQVRAILIRIRIWDFKSEQTRQVTIIQDV